jgi:predicted ribosomally synthesized peptide with SipW-like signal peptide
MKSKLILTMAAVVVCATLIVGGTLAYFTSTDSATNEFTIGNVTIDLTEPNWDSSAASNLVPGRTIDKNPTVTIGSTSEDCYVRVTVTMPTDLVDIVTYTVNSGWTQIGSGVVSGNNTVFTYAAGKLSADDEVTLFDDVTVAGSATEDDLDDFDIVINAYAVQAEGFATEAAAFAAVTF